MALETLLPDPEEKTAVDPSQQTSEDGGGYRFNFFGRPGLKEKEKKKKNISPGPAVKINLSPEALATLKHEDTKEGEHTSTEESENG